MNTVKVDAKHYAQFRHGLDEIGDYKTLGIAWNGRILNTEPKSDRKTIRLLNGDFEDNFNLVAYLLDPRQLDITKEPWLYNKPEKKIMSVLSNYKVKEGLKNAMQISPVIIERNEFEDEIFYEMGYASKKGPFVIHREDFGEYEKGYDILEGVLYSIPNKPKPANRLNFLKDRAPVRKISHALNELNESMEKAKERRRELERIEILEMRNRK